MEILQVNHPTKRVRATIPLASSKSESNRALIIQALSGNKIHLANLSEARDTQTLIKLLNSKEEVLDVIDAGTTMRFLTAYCAVTNRKCILTGTERMKQRPIKILVDALLELGADIEYVESEGFPPLRIKGFEQKKNEISIKGDVSSQFISALLMVAPILPMGLKLTLLGEVASRPYIEMTLELMKYFGIEYIWHWNEIVVEHQAYKPKIYAIESDWSGASYWYSIAALAEEAEITLLGLRKDSLQGDSVIIKLMEHFGVSTDTVEGGVILRRKPVQDKEFEFDFTHCPDIAQTIAVLCAARGIPARLSGLRSLRIKETDRIAALENELGLLGVHIVVEGDDSIIIPRSKINFEHPRIHTYEDHRMAMAFAPLGLLHEVLIEDPRVVVKSYPAFWRHLETAGFELTLRD
ncbi:MAG: 3-phosphoshikimate 1-carboxyvinyltransferase [Cytophagales bacterium]|nr:3-phosphoshikimate 1-carboxyvinyltransferase [Cytophagales bacterium]MDW8383374.1 3-phosphoshikimate 1-carboxyvinyltransferase [Flammeovirgaceae bacterium]